MRTSELLRKEARLLDFGFAGNKRIMWGPQHKPAAETGEPVDLAPAAGAPELLKLPKSHLLQQINV
jgi:hypothetical protein